MISDKFCAAKWNEFSINLQQLTIRCCHLADTIRFTIEDYRENYLYFFHNERLQNIRKEMLNNQEPEGCNYCWRIEKGGQFKSERFYKTMSENNFPDIPRIEESIKKDEIYMPSYLEIAFNNTCNLRCLYCDGAFSSSLRNLIENNRIRNLRPQRIDEKKAGKFLYYLYTGDEYKEIKNIFFTKTFPEVVKTLRTLRLTGGEVSIQSEFEEIINIARGRDILLAINTNLSSSDVRYENFKNKLKEINGEFQRVDLYVSLDTFGKRAEWIRDRLDYARLEKRIIQLLDEIPNMRLNIMCTLNVFSINKSNIKFLKFLKYIKKRFENRTYLGIETIRDPKSFCLRNLPLEFIKYYNECVEYLESNKEYFSEAEINNFKKCIEEIKDGSLKEKDDFLKQIEELNEDLISVNKKDFFSVFPEYKRIIKMRKTKQKTLNNNLKVFI